MRPAIAIVLFCTAARAAAAQSASQLSDIERRRLASADSAFSAGAPHALTERLYRGVLQANPDNSRAIFRLAQLGEVRPDSAVALYRRYVSLEPGDAWGQIALGDALARAGSADEALTAYAAAERLAPGERDVQIGRARMLARVRRSSDAIARYEHWLATHRGDAEAWRELAAVRARAGRTHSAIQALERAQSLSPNTASALRLRALRANVATTAEPTTSGTRDSDGNATARLGMEVGISPIDAVGLRIAGAVTRISGPIAPATVLDGAVGVGWRPTPTLRIEARSALTVGNSPTSGPVANGGRGVGPPPGVGTGTGPGTGSGNAPANGARSFLVPNGDLRLDWKPVGGSSLNVRVGRTLLAASGTLVANRVVRDEVAGRGDLDIGAPIRVRGLARLAHVSSSLDDNQRTILGGGVVLPTAFGEVTGTMQRLAFAHPSASGYFAPRSARTAEVGSYAELESDRGVRLAIDLGAGAQQVTDTLGVTGKWSPAFRGWGDLALPLAPGREIHLQLEAYDAAIGSEVATTGASRWKFISASLALRWAMY